MNLYVCDTHALYWYLKGSSRLGRDAQAAFEEAVRGDAVIHIPAIVMAEFYYLNEKTGRSLELEETFQHLEESGLFEFVSFEAEHVLDFDQDAPLEMHDRMIVGVARLLGAPCLTRDGQIVASGLVPTVW